MNFPSHVFRAYDIRGIAQGDESALRQAQDDDFVVEITPEFAKALGQAFVEELGVDKPRIAVGRDNRLTGKELSQALIEGLVSAGAEVVEIDYATSPYLYFVVCNPSTLRPFDRLRVQGSGQVLDGGIEITASHNPKEYNGFKIVGKEAVPLSGEEIISLRDRIQDSGFRIKSTEDRVQGAEVDQDTDFSSKVIKSDFKREYFDKLKSLAPVGRKLKVVVDCGNGTAGYFAPDFFRELDLEVVELYCEPDGNFPNHMPNPENAASLVDLQKKVIEEKADLGIAFDGDGDRVGIVDEKGEIISPDRLIILLARDLLSREKGAEVIFDVKCSNVLAEEIKKAGGKPLRWKTGHSFIKKKMRETGALLAGEVSGHIFFKENYFGVDDGLLAAAKIVSIVSQSEKTVTELLANVPGTFTTPEIKIGVTDEKKFEVMQKIINEFAAQFDDCDTLDGVRVSFSDGSWGLVRASNTSPYLTLRFEALSEERLEEVKNIFRDKLTQYPELDLVGLI